MRKTGFGQALTHLVSLGHRDIAAIAGPQTVSTGFKRYNALHAARRMLLGLDTKKLSVVFARAFNEKEGERCAEELLAAGRSFTAVVCANDRLAVGAITALRRHGIDCPGDISVTGFNDMPLADRLSPPLTTVRVQHYKAGSKPRELIVEIIENEPSSRGTWFCRSKSSCAARPRSVRNRNADEAAFARTRDNEDARYENWICRPRRHGSADRAAPDGGGSRGHRLEPHARARPTPLIAAGHELGGHAARGRRAVATSCSPIVTDGAAVRAVALGPDGVARRPAARRHLYRHEHDRAGRQPRGRGGVRQGRARPCSTRRSPAARSRSRRATPR